MKRRRTYILFNRIYIILEFVLITYVIWTRYHTYLNQKYVYYIVISLIQIIPIIVMLMNQYVKKYDIYLLLIFLYITVVTIVGRGSFTDCLVASVWLFSLLYGIRISSSILKNKVLYLVLFVIISLLYISNFRQNYYYNVWQARTNFSEAQLLLYTSPVIFLFIQELDKRKQKKYEIIFSLVLLGLTFVSFKRTTLLAIAISLFVFFYVKYISENLYKHGRFQFILLLVVGIVSIYILNDMTEGFFEHRFSLAIETGGNGRTTLWERTLKAFSKSNLWYKIFGHGFDAVRVNLGQSAHNDYIEVLYDYGLVGFFVLVSLLIMLIKIYRKLNNKIKPIFAFTITGFVVSMMFTHIIIYPLYSNSLMTTLGILVGISKNRYVGEIIEQI